MHYVASAFSMIKGRNKEELRHAVRAYHYYLELTTKISQLLGLRRALGNV